MKAISFFFISIIAVFIYCLTPFSCSAQLSAKGYKGKRFSVNYDLFTFPNLSNYTYVGTTGLFAWNTRHYLGASYVVGRNQELSLQVGYHRTGLQTTISSNFGGGTKFYDSFQYIEGLDFAFTLKTYPLRRRGMLAPLGAFVGVGLMVGNYNCRDSLISETNKEGKIFLDGRIPESFNLTNIGFKLDFGSQRILWDKLILRFNIQLVPSAYFMYVIRSPERMSYLKPARISLNANNAYEESIRDAVAARINANILMNFNFGIGYLIF